MVDSNKRLDKIMPPPTYRIESTIETHDQRGGQQGQNPEEDEFSQSGNLPGWQKFHTDAKNRRALKIRKGDIRMFTFRQVVMQKGLVIIEVDIHIVNGQILPVAHVITSKLEAYRKFKKYSPKQELEVAELVEGDEIEVSVLHKGNKVLTAADLAAAQEEQLKAVKTKAVPQAHMHNIDWILVSFGGAFIVIIILLLIWIFS